MDEDEIERARFAAGVRMALARIEGATTKLDLSRRVGVSAMTLDRWSTGSSFPTERNLARLARLSGMEQEDIRRGDDSLVGYDEYTIRKAD